MSLAGLKGDFAAAADPAKAALLARFFKTGRGEYAEGDKFLGLTVPATRAIAKKHRDLPLSDVAALLRSPWHEHRLCALLLLEAEFRRGGPELREKIYKLYLANASFINNWDLVDLSAPRIVGVWLKDRSRAPLYELARSPLLWERRIAMLACFAFIYDGDGADGLKIARLLLGDKHDLMHKAVGWMLREIGKRCSEKLLLDFLEKNYARLPRTTLRYAIERFSVSKRKQFLAGRF